MLDDDPENLVLRGLGAGRLRQFRRGSAFRLGNWDVEHSATHGDSAIGRMPQTRTRFCFQKVRLLQKLPVPPYMGISPTSGRRAMENMQLIGAVELRLRLAMRDDTAHRIGGVNRPAL